MNDQSLEPPALAAQLIALTGRLQRRLRRSYHASGITPARLSALAHVVEHGPCTGGQLATAEQITAPTVSRTLDALEEGGYITRVPSPHDRRITVVTATAAGRGALANVTRWQVQQLATAIGELAPDQRNVLAAAARVLRTVLG